jgi:hypothetical protein
VIGGGARAKMSSLAGQTTACRYLKCSATGSPQPDLPTTATTERTARASPVPSNRFSSVAEALVSPVISQGTDPQPTGTPIPPRSVTSPLPQGAGHPRWVGTARARGSVTRGSWKNRDLRSGLTFKRCAMWPHASSRPRAAALI